MRLKGSKYLLVLFQLLLTGLVLCIFALFHHVIPRMMLTSRPIEPIGVVARHTVVSEAEPSPASATLSLQERFGEHFSPVPRLNGNLYSSPNIAFEVQRIEHPDRFPSLTYFVADIYLSDIRCLRTATPENMSFAEAVYIARQTNALLAINGDGVLTSSRSLAVRNGVIYCKSPNQMDICVLYYDGSMRAYGPDEYSLDEILAQKPYQIWQFGPSLLDDDGQPLQEFNIPRELRGEHPRTAIGYFEPGHYCFVVVDGRQRGYSSGANIADLAEIMSELGCRVAYNLDGGASSMMVLGGQLINSPSSSREISDMLIVAEVDLREESGT